MFKDKPWVVVSTDNFQIEFPKHPDVDTNLLNSDIGILKMHSFMYDASKKRRSKNKIFSLVYVSYPSDIIHADKIEELEGIFRNTIDGAVANVQGKLLSEKDVKIGDYPGRMVEIDYQEGFAVILLHCYLVDNVMYMIQTISESDNYPNESSKRFIQSFKLR